MFGTEGRSISIIGTDTNLPRGITVSQPVKICVNKLPVCSEDNKVILQKAQPIEGNVTSKCSLNIVSDNSPQTRKFTYLKLCPVVPLSSTEFRAFEVCHNLRNWLSLKFKKCVYRGSLFWWSDKDERQVCFVGPTTMKTVPLCTTGVSSFLEQCLEFASLTPNLESDWFYRCSSHIMYVTQSWLTCFHKGDYYMYNNDKLICRRYARRPQSFTYCSREVVKKLLMISGFAKENIDVRRIPICSVIFKSEYGKSISPASASLQVCFHRNKIYYWRDNFVCRNHQKVSKILGANKWTYCNKTVLNLMQALSKMKDQPTTMIQWRQAPKRKADVGFMMTSEQPSAKLPSASDIEEDVLGLFDDFTVQVKNMTVTTALQYLLNEDAQKMRRKLLRKLLHIKNSIEVQFTLVVRSEDVEGTDFPAYVTRILRTNVEKIDEGGSYVVDIDSVKVTAVIVSDEIRRLSKRASNVRIGVVVLCVVVCVLLATACFVLKRRWDLKKTYRYYGKQ